MGWFFGFKLHMAVNETGDLLAFKLTPGNSDDRTPVPELTKGILGKLLEILEIKGIFPRICSIN